MKYLTSILLAISSGMPIYAQWIKLNKVNNNNYTQVSFPDAANGWIGQYGFTMPLNTTNKGEN